MSTQAKIELQGSTRISGWHVYEQIKIDWPTYYSLVAGDPAYTTMPVVGGFSNSMNRWLVQQGAPLWVIDEGYCIFDCNGIGVEREMR